MRPSVRRGGAVVLLAWIGALLPAASAPALAQGVFEETEAYDVHIVIEPSGDLLVTETIVQQFGSTPRHGIFRYIPNRLRYDDTFDRVYPIELVSVTASPAGTPDDVETKEENGNFVIRIGDPDVEITGRHTYEITYRVEGAMNRFETHDELYWNAIGDRWEQTIRDAHVVVEGPVAVTRVACFQGPFGSTLACGQSEVRKGRGVFSQANLQPYNGMSVVVALPPGTVERTEPILDERWSLDGAFSRTPLTVGGSVGLLVLVLGEVGVLMWRRGRDVRWRGSQVTQVMGGSDAETQAVPLFERATSVVEFAPPEDLRPGQVGTLIDEEANTLDVTATIVDLAVRKHLVIQEIPKKWLFGKADWNLRRLPAPDGDRLLPYERSLLDGLFADGEEVALSDLRKKFAERLQKVKEALYNDMVARKWFLRRPDRVRQMWTVIGVLVLGAGIAAAVVLAYFTKLALLGIPLVIGGIVLLIGAKRMPARTAKGTAMTRRVLGFRTVIEKAEEHMARWAEQEHVFTRFLPYAVVFGVTEKWAEAFEPLGLPDDTGWYVSGRPFVYAEFASSIDSFTVTTSGTISSTPAGSGGSGFGGGGFSGGGGGGGGGGSW